MKYRVGFDIGIKSVGYAVIENDNTTEEPMRIVDLGVRTFDANEVKDTGESTAQTRRELRGVRRRRRRKEFRFERMEKLLNNTFSVNYKEDVKNVQNVDVYKLRANALDVKISNIELCKVIFNLLKRRGFKSNRKEITKTKEEGKLKKAIAENQEFMAKSGYITIGESIYKDPRFKIECNGRVIYNVRNHGDYRNCFYRDDLKNELNLILESQQKFGNSLITTDFINKVLDIFSAQRNFDEGPGGNSPYKATFQVGNCTFITTEKRAPKASLTFERFTALSRLNSLKINFENLTDEQISILQEKINNCNNIKFSQIRKWLNLDYSQVFNLCNYYIKPKDAEGLTEKEVVDKAESKDFVTFNKTTEIRKALKVSSPLEYQDLFDEIALMLSMCKSDSTIDEYISSHIIFNNLTTEQINNIKALNFDKFGNLSVKAMRNIIPFLQQGKRYDEACALAGYNHSVKNFGKRMFLKGKEIQERLNEITSPTVKRAINQTIRILNEIIKKYGSPQFVTIELSRDFERTPNERKTVEKAQQDRYKENESYLDVIKKYKAIPTGVDFLKMRLYNEQNCKCMYSGERIELDKLFYDNYYQIDHAIPISRSLDDSYLNKVLVKTEENQNKRDMIPYEYFTQFKTPQEWDEYVVRVNLLKNIKKKKLLLIKEFTENRTRDYIARNSNDTRYISKAILNILQDYLQTAPNKKYSKVIKSVNGGVTAYLRKCWNINKIREDGDSHHCVDAGVIAVATDGAVQKITKFNQVKEKYIIKDDLIIEKFTGRVIEKDKMAQDERAELEKLSKILPKPYENFVKELKLRSMVKYDNSNYNEREKQELKDIGYLDEEIDKIKPLFVSRMKAVKTTGPIHKDTMYSTKIYDNHKLLIKTVELKKLKIVDKPEKEPIKDDKHPNKSIDGYYRPLDDRKLYLMLKESLIKDKDCFKNVREVYKPSKNGVQGMPVRSVKVCEYKSDVIQVNGGAFINDKIYRIDVFTKDNKFYTIPVYMKDVYAHKLPNKIVARNKPWIDLNDSYKFKFSLYQNDLIKIKWKKNSVFTKVHKNINSQKPDKIELNEGLFYYNGFDISTSSIEIFTHDRCYTISGAGMQNLEIFEKYHVNIMGKVYKAPEEVRKEI